MLIRDTKHLYRHEVEKNLPKDASASDVLDALFGTYQNDYRSKVDFVVRVWGKDNKTSAQRLNHFWAYPLTFIPAPVRYVLYGNIGWDTTTRLGRFILKATGNLSD